MEIMEWKWQKLTPQDITQVMDLQRRMTESLPDPRWYYTSTAEEFGADLRRGMMVGLWDNGRLIALGSACTGIQRGGHSYAVLTGDEAEGSFDFCDVMVDPAYRRMGIHSSLLNLFKTMALEAGCTRIYATIDPENIPSRRSFEKAGFCPVLQRKAYDGRPRIYYRYVNHCEEQNDL